MKCDFVDTSRNSRYYAKYLYNPPLSGVLTPYRGTPLYDQLVEEGRILEDRGLAFCNGYNVAFQPKLMSPDELLHAHRSLWNRAFSPTFVFRRITRAIRYLRPGALLMATAMKGFYGLKQLRGNTPRIMPEEGSY